jgi:hypothetical protein
VKRLAVFALGMLIPVAVLTAQRGAPVLGAEPMPGTAAEHLSKLKLPAGFSIALYADKVPGARSMALGSDGTVFVGTRAQTVYAVVDRNKDFKADEVLTPGAGRRRNRPS